MPNLKKSSHIRSILKGISWRFLATADTILVVLVVTCLNGQCNMDDALKIGVSEFLVKFLVYYLHERLWLNILGHRAESARELIYKSVSWRITATSITFFISGYILKAFGEVALYIALIELVSKFVLYYGHEKLWLKLPLGKIRSFIFGKVNT